MCAENHGMNNDAFTFSTIILGTYEIAMIAAVIWYAQQRKSVE